jgi:hypothetical protein
MLFSGLWPQILYSPDEGDGGGGGDGDPDENGDGDSQEDDDQEEDVDSEGEDQEDEDPYKDLTPKQLKARLADKESLVGKLRKESKGRRLKLKKIEKAEAEREKAEMTEVEKATTEKTEAEKKASDSEAELKQLRIERAIEAQAIKVGVKKKLSLLLKLVDLDDIEIDEDGKVDEKAVAKAVKAVVKEVPELLGKSKPDLESEDGESDGDQIKIDEDELRATFGLKKKVKANRSDRK